MSIITVETKKALVFNEKRITDFIWNDVEVRNQIIMCRGDNGLIACFNRHTGKVLFKIQNAYYHIDRDYPFIEICNDDSQAFYSLITGKPIIPLGKYEVLKISAGYIFPYKDGLEGICSFDGVEILPPKYNKVWLYNELIIANKSLNAEYNIYRYEDNNLVQLVEDADEVWFDEGYLIAVKENIKKRLYSK